MRPVEASRPVRKLRVAGRKLLSFALFAPLLAHAAGMAVAVLPHQAFTFARLVVRSTTGVLAFKTVAAGFSLRGKGAPVKGAATGGLVLLGAPKPSWCGVEVARRAVYSSKQHRPQVQRRKWTG